MQKAQSSSYLYKRSFVDVDDLACEAKQWDLDFKQIEMGPFDGHLLQFGVAGVHISDARFHRTLIQSGAPPADMRTVAVPARRDLRLEWRGQAINGNCLMVFPRGAELASVSSPDFHVFTCSFSEDLLDYVSDSMQLGPFSELTKGIEAIEVAPDAIHHVQNLLRSVCESLRCSSAYLATSKLEYELTINLACRLVTAIAQAHGPCPQITTSKRFFAVEKACAYIEKNLTDNLSLADLCKISGVSERTLRYAFVERFGIGPKQFLQIQRLMGVRRELRAASPKKRRVADIANSWGFWHIGQFAADYRQRFGELPSTSLQKSQQMYL